MTSQVNQSEGVRLEWDFKMELRGRTNEPERNNQPIGVFLHKKQMDFYQSTLLCYSLQREDAKWCIM